MNLRFMTVWVMFERVLDDGGNIWVCRFAWRFGRIYCTILSRRDTNDNHLHLIHLQNGWGRCETQRLWRYSISII